MSTQNVDYNAAPDYYRREWDGRGELMDRARGFLSHPVGFAIAGLAVGAAVVAAGMYVAPDLKRYLKMRSM